MDIRVSKRDTEYSKLYERAYTGKVYWTADHIPVAWHSNPDGTSMLTFDTDPGRDLNPYISDFQKFAFYERYADEKYGRVYIPSLSKSKLVRAGQLFNPALLKVTVENVHCFENKRFTHNNFLIANWSPIGKTEELFLIPGVLAGFFVSVILFVVFITLPIVLGIYEIYIATALSFILMVITLGILIKLSEQSMNLLKYTIERVCAAKINIIANNGRYVRGPIKIYAGGKIVLPSEVKATIRDMKVSFAKLNDDLQAISRFAYVPQLEDVPPPAAACPLAEDQEIERKIGNEEVFDNNDRKEEVSLLSAPLFVGDMM